MYLLPMVETQPSFDAPRTSCRSRCLAASSSPSSQARDRREGFQATGRLAQGQSRPGDVRRAQQRHHSAFHGLAARGGARLQMTRVPYRGSAPIVNDLIGGHLPFGIVTVADSIAQHRAGSVRIVAVQQRGTVAVPAGRADTEGERHRSGRRLLVRHVAAGRQLAGVCQATERGGRRGAREARGAGKAAGDRPDPGRIDAGGTRRRSSPPTPRSGSRSSRRPATRSRTERDQVKAAASDRGELGLVPDADQDAAPDLQLVVGVGR